MVAWDVLYRFHKPLWVLWGKYNHTWVSLVNYQADSHSPKIVLKEKNFEKQKLQVQFPSLFLWPTHLFLQIIFVTFLCA